MVEVEGGCEEGGGGRLEMEGGCEGRRVDGTPVSMMEGCCEAGIGSCFTSILHMAPPTLSSFSSSSYTTPFTHALLLPWRQYK